MNSLIYYFQLLHFGQNESCHSLEFSNFIPDFQRIQHYSRLDPTLASLSKDLQEEQSHDYSGNQASSVTSNLK